MSPTVAVVGGGIAGLAAAWELTQRAPSATVVLLERSARLGGKIQSAAFAGRSVDLGADAFVARRPEGVELCRELGIEHELVGPGSRQAFVWNEGRLHPLPAGMALGIPTHLRTVIGSGLLSASGRARAVAGALVPALHPRLGSGEDAPIGELVGHVFGRQVVQRITDPLIGGIHAGRADELSAAAVYPPLHQAATRRGRLVRNLRRLTPEPADPASPVFLAPRQGLSSLVGTLAEQLAKRNVELRTGFTVRSITPGAPLVIEGEAGQSVEADALVMATPAKASSAMLSGAHPDLARWLAQVPYSSVALVTMRFAAGDVTSPLEGTGYLVPRGDALVTACTFITSKWPQLWHADDVLVRVSAGHAGDERAMAMDDDSVVRACVDELSPAIGLRAPPVDAMVARFPDAFPQYLPGHLDHVELWEAQAQKIGNVALAGAALRGVGIPACVASGRRAARAVLGRLGLIAP